MKDCRQVPDGGTTFQIYLNREEKGAISGSVLGKGLAEPLCFSSLSRMVLMLEELMDISETLPQTETVKSVVTPTVELQILFRQNYSWQGRFRQAGQQKFTPFHSVLELLMLLETILEQ